MVRGEKSWIRDAALRAIGLAMLLIGWLAIRYLAGDYPMHRPQGPSLVDIASATVGFLSLSGGAALTWLGVHVFDEIRISRRWTRR